MTEDPALSETKPVRAITDIPTSPQPAPAPKPARKSNARTWAIIGGVFLGFIAIGKLVDSVESTPPPPGPVVPSAQRPQHPGSPVAAAKATLAAVPTPPPTSATLQAAAAQAAAIPYNVQVNTPDTAKEYATEVRSLIQRQQQAELGVRQQLEIVGNRQPADVPPKRIEQVRAAIGARMQIAIEGLCMTCPDPAAAELQRATQAAFADLKTAMQALDSFMLFGLQQDSKQFVTSSAAADLKIAALKKLLSADSMLVYSADPTSATAESQPLPPIIANSVSPPPTPAPPVTFIPVEGSEEQFVNWMVRASSASGPVVQQILVGLYSPSLTLEYEMAMDNLWSQLAAACAASNCDNPPAPGSTRMEIPHAHATTALRTYRDAVASRNPSTLLTAVQHHQLAVQTLAQKFPQYATLLVPSPQGAQPTRTQPDNARDYFNVIGSACRDLGHDAYAVRDQLNTYAANPNLEDGKELRRLLDKIYQTCILVETTVLPESARQFAELDRKAKIAFSEQKTAMEKVLFFLKTLRKRDSNDALEAMRRANESLDTFTQYTTVLANQIRDQ